MSRTTNTRTAEMPISYLNFAGDCAKLAEAAARLADLTESHQDFQGNPDFIRQTDVCKSILSDVTSLGKALLPVRF